MALTEKVEKQNILYLSIVAGILREKVQEGTEGAVKRTYIHDEQTKVKWEILHKNLKGHLRSVEFKVGDFGKQAIFTITSGDDTAQLFLPVKSRYFTDFAKKIPTMDIKEEITINPFDFVGKNDKQVTGMTVYQGAAKLGSYYWNGSEAINGIPTVVGDYKDYDSDDWAAFFTNERNFLVNELKDFSQLLEAVKIDDGLEPIEDLFPTAPRPTPADGKTHKVGKGSVTKHSIKQPDLDMGAEKVIRD